MSAAKGRALDARVFHLEKDADHYAYDLLVAVIRGQKCYSVRKYKREVRVDGLHVPVWAVVVRERMTT